MAFVLASTASDLASAKRQWEQVQAQGYHHDVAWSLYSQDPSVLVWLRLLAKKTKVPIFVSNADRLEGPCFAGPNAGLNAALALGFSYDSPVVVFQHGVRLLPDALDGLTQTRAGSLTAACTGFCRDASLWRVRVARAFSGAAAGVVSAPHALNELRAALSGGFFFDEPQACLDALFVSTRAAGTCCFAPYAPEPLYVFAETAYEYGVAVEASDKPWAEHAAANGNDARFAQEWQARQDAETLAWLVHAALSATENRHPSDFLVDGLCAHSLFVPKAALDASVLETVRRSFDSALAKKAALLCQPPVLPDPKTLKRQARVFFEAQAAWEQTLQVAVEKDLAEKLRV